MELSHELSALVPHGCHLPAKAPSAGVGVSQMSCDNHYFPIVLVQSWTVSMYLLFERAVGVATGAISHGRIVAQFGGGIGCWLPKHDIDAAGAMVQVWSEYRLDGHRRCRRGDAPQGPATARRKTMAGMEITRGEGGFTLRRSSIRIKNKVSATPIAKMAEKLLYRRMGIINEGDQLTEEAIGKFAALFRGRLPAIAIDALRALFRLDCDLATAMEEALVAHGGAGAMEL
ncbi:hypothetical protein D1007_51503 [Hordeum vulgare]|nr:hypothetical protein D1007_51503 [Hordeum vulgare]